MQLAPASALTRQAHVAELLTTGILRVLASRALGPAPDPGADGAAKHVHTGVTPAAGRHAA